MAVNDEEALRVLSGNVGEAAHAKPKPMQEYAQNGDPSFQPWFTSSAGIKYESGFDDEGNMIVRAMQDVYAILEANKAEATENSGYSLDKSLRRVARIPALLRNKVLIQTNNQVDLWRPETDEKYYKQFLNDIDNRKLRTAPGRLRGGGGRGGSAARR